MNAALSSGDDKTPGKLKGLDLDGNRVLRNPGSSNADFAIGELWIMSKLPYEFRLHGTSFDEAVSIMGNLGSGLYFIRPCRFGAIVRLELEEDAVGLRLAFPESFS